MIEWCKNYALGLWILGGAIFGSINLAYGGLFMLFTYIAFIVYCLITFPKK